MRHFILMEAFVSEENSQFYQCVYVLTLAMHKASCEFKRGIWQPQLQGIVPQLGWNISFTCVWTFKCICDLFTVHHLKQSLCYSYFYDIVIANILINYSVLRQDNVYIKQN